MATSTNASNAPDDAATPPPRPRRSRSQRRQVRWARRLRRLGLAAQNALELVRVGRLGAPYGAPFEVAHVDAIYRLRRYGASDGATARADATGRLGPILLIPPLMLASEVYDMAPDISAVGFLGRAGVDVWLTDFGAPEREEGGMHRTLDDHVRAVSDAVDRVRAATGRDVHLAGYSQGGMFAYQTAAFRRGAGLASVVTFGSPVDLHRTLTRVSDVSTERIAGALRSLVSLPLAHVDGLPGFVTSSGFRLLSARKEVQQVIDFVRKLHDRSALEKRESKRMFLAGAGFVAWPGPALRKFVDEMIVGNRMASGGFVIDGRTATLADIECPILYFLGERDDMARPAAVRGIRAAAPRAASHEIAVRAGHFGLVVGSAALGVTWPAVVDWLRWRTDGGPRPASLPAPRRAGGDDDALDDDALGDDDRDDDDRGDDDAAAAPLDPWDFDAAFGELQVDAELVRDVVGDAARALWNRVGDVAQDLGDYLDNLRWQVPRLQRLRRTGDDTPVGFARVLAEQAAAMPDGTFFLWNGRAFTYADADRRVDAVVRGLIACRLRPGQRVAVWMPSRPSHLTAVAALDRLGAVPVLISTETPHARLAAALAAGEAEAIITDPDHAASARAVFAGSVLVLGGGPDRAIPDVARGGLDVADAVVDLEAIDPASVTLPAWYRPNPGRARDLGLVIVAAGRHQAPRASRITNRRWAFSALGAAAACTLTPRDTVYCTLPLHHPAGFLVAVGGALIGGARLALAATPAGQPGWADAFWPEVRRNGVTVVFYAGDMCRALVDAPHAPGEDHHPVRLFAGSGMRRDVWRRLIERFGARRGAAAVLELYASTEANAVLVNASGAKLGALGRPLPASAELAIAAYDFAADDFVRTPDGRLVRAGVDRPGMLLARLDAPHAPGTAAAEIAHLAPARVLRDVFAAGDTWFVTGDIMRRDSDGDHWLLDRQTDVVRSPDGPIWTPPIEDALCALPAVAQAVVFAGERADGRGQEPIAAVTLRPGARLDHAAALRQLAETLPPEACPRVLHEVAAIPMTDGFRPLKAAGAPRSPTTERRHEIPRAGAGAVFDAALRVPRAGL